MMKPTKAVNPNHIFVDTNVLIGGYSGDPCFQKDAECLHYLFSLKGKRLYISTLSVAQLISTYQKRKSNDEIRRIEEIFEADLASEYKPLIGVH